MPPVQCWVVGHRGQRRPRNLLSFSTLLLLLLAFIVGPVLGALHIPDDLKQPPVLLTQPESQTAYFADDIHLSCRASGIPTPSIRWTKDGEEFGDTNMTGSGFLIANESDPISLYLGKYRCYAANELGTAMSDLVQLTPEPIPTLPKIRRRTVDVLEGESAILLCNPPQSSVSPVIHWMDRRLRHITLSERVNIGLDGNLYFANVIASDKRVDYMCNAQYIIARTILPMEPIFLNVTDSNSVVRSRRPHLVHSSEAPHHSTHLGLRGHSLTLECIPRGLPTPTVHWRRKDGSHLSDHAKPTNFHRWLEIEKVLESDDGEYECVASNSLGSVSHSFTVTVEAAPYWTKTTPSQLYSPGETVRLDCHAEGIPTPTISWSINGVPVQETDAESRRKVTSGVLILTDVKYSDTAVYQCEAENKHGRILVNMYIYVIELPPQILTDDEVIYTETEGKTALLECKTFGSPRPKIHWGSPGLGPLLSNPRISQMTNGALQISNTSREDSRIYICSVDEFNLTISAELQVFNKTEIVSSPQALTVMRGDSVLLLCKAQLDQRISRPLIQWRRNGQKIRPSARDGKHAVDDEGSLTITNVQFDNEGQYSCEVITDMDMASLTSSVTVVDKPDPPHSVELSEKADRSVTISWTPGEEHNSPVFEFVIELMEEQHSHVWERFENVSGDIRHLEAPLLPFSTNRFRVSAVNSYGQSDPSAPSDFYVTPPAAPDFNPETVRSESTDSDSLVITWQEMDKRHRNGPDFQYHVSWRQAAGKDPHWQESYITHPPLIVNQTGTYTAFEIKVQALNSIGRGPSPNSVIGHSGEDFPTDAPSGISVAMSGTNEITVRWNAVSPESVRGALLGYKIYMRRLGSRTGRKGRALGKRALAADRELEKEIGREMEREKEKAIKREEEVREVVVYGGKKVEEVVSGLRFYSDYELSISAFNSKGEGPQSDSHAFSTPEGAPGPPTFLGLESPSETELTVHWRAPDEPNGVLTGYMLQYREIVESRNSLMQVEPIDDPTVTHFTLENLDKGSTYLFYLIARTKAGEGEAIKWEGATLLDGAPPNNINVTLGESYANLSWVPGDRFRNVGFSLHYLRKSDGDRWEESEVVNSTQAFYQLHGLQPSTQYRLQIRYNNVTHWEQEVETNGPALDVMVYPFATQGWFIGLISAIVLLLLILLILCFIKRSKGGKYSVKDKEEGQVDSEARQMKDETFGEYSDNEEKRSVSQPSLCVESKLGSDDSLAEYGDSVDIQFNEDGSFIGQYSGRRDGHNHGGHESSGATSPNNPSSMPPPSISFANSVTGILDRGN